MNAMQRSTIRLLKSNQRVSSIMRLKWALVGKIRYFRRILLNPPIDWRCNQWRGGRMSQWRPREPEIDSHQVPRHIVSAVSDGAAGERGRRCLLWKELSSMKLKMGLVCFVISNLKQIKFIL
ncbi:hypothetical protein CEXT_666391 [Caerostris extrusa]|uniref:Uncharacterized protein n=1 Tax=Caerostris extrusa TaxID=172846 RepID=A0AAV4MW90_CAEEX|nr:hypothetical protein CEXT_666391 [Caerostris extrusa]